MTEPEHKVTASAAEGQGFLRASDADREQVISTLKAAFVQGRLTKDELDARAGQTFASRTYAELATLTADLPAGLTRARPPEPTRQTVNKKAVVALTGATPALVGMMAAARAMPDATPWPLALPVIVIVIVLFLAVPTGWLWLFHAWLDQRAVRQSAQGLPPGTGGQASGRLPPADPGTQLPPAGRGRPGRGDATGLETCEPETATGDDAFVLLRRHAGHQDRRAGSAHPGRPAAGARSPGYPRQAVAMLAHRNTCPAG